MKSKRLLSQIAALTLTASLIIPMVPVEAAVGGVFTDKIEPAKGTAYTGKQFKSKPLVILMNFKDYKYTDLDERESWKINNFSGNDTTPEFYEKLFFSDSYTDPKGVEYTTLKKFYEEESGGSYDFDGKAYGWYEAEHEAAYYGGADPEQWGSDQNNATKLVIEALEAVAKDPNVDLSEFDVEDKWDKDKDGNYYEPDGILDNLIVMAPGQGEQHGGGSLGKDAIWPFRAGVSWYSVNNFQKYDITDTKGNKWQGEDYCVFSQDLPLDLLGHEFGHLLGLPDLYESNSEPPVQNWSLMGGSYTGAQVQGSRAASYGAIGRDQLQKDFDKCNLDARWANDLDITLDDLKEEGMTLDLNQSNIKGDNLDLVRIDLPKRLKQVAKPKKSKYYFSGKGDNLANEMTTTIDMPQSEELLFNFLAWYDIDPGYDFASVQVREVGTETWESVEGDITTTDNYNDETPNDPTDRNPGHGITGSTIGFWVNADFDFTKFSGKNMEVKFKFWTDTNTPGEGFYVDNIKLYNGEDIIFKDDAEGEPKFTLNGFTQTDGKVYYDNYYLLEWRNGDNALSDRGLNEISSTFEGFKFDPGMVMWYINKTYGDGHNKPDQFVGEGGHPGELYAGVVDADRNINKWVQGKDTGIDAINYQMHDAAFSLNKGSDLKKVWDNGAISEDTNKFMNPMFDDKKDYSYAKTGLEEAGLVLENNGLKIFVTEESANRSSSKIHISTENTAKFTQQENFLSEIKLENEKLTVEADQSYAEKAYATYVTEGGKRFDVELTLDKDGKYTANLDFIKTSKEPVEMSHIIFHDSEGSAKALYNSRVHKVFGTDLGEAGNSDITDPAPGSGDVSVKYTDANEANGTNVFKAGKDSKVSLNIKNGSKVEQDLTVYVGIYNQNDKLVKKVVSPQYNIKAGENKDVTLDLKVPLNSGEKVKVFVVDSKDGSFKPVSNAKKFTIEK
ncbi:MAG: immune inhibitor A [Clostridium sp.]